MSTPLPPEAERALADLTEPHRTRFRALLLTVLRAKAPPTPARSGRHLDAEEVAAELVRCRGCIRAAARALKCAPSSVSRHRGLLLFKQRNAAPRNTAPTTKGD